MTWSQLATISFWVIVVAAAVVLYLRIIRPARIRDAELKAEVRGWEFGEVEKRSRFVLAVMAETLHTQMDKYYLVPLLVDELRAYDWEDLSPPWDPDSWNNHSLSACLRRLEAEGFVLFDIDNEGRSTGSRVKLTGNGLREVERLMEKDESALPNISFGDLTNSQVVIMSEDVKQTLRDAQATHVDLDPAIPSLIERLMRELEVGSLKIDDGDANELASEAAHVAEVAEQDGMSLRLKRGLRSLSALVMGAAQTAIRDELLEEFGRILDHGNWLSG